MNCEGEKFLLKLYRELYNKESVKHSGTISDNKYELLNKYLKRLEKTEQIFISEKHELIKYLKNRYYDKYVIKKEDIDSEREDTKEKIINSQKESLERWINYLMKEDTSHPMWARYWAFQGMLQLGKYDKDNKKFTNRSKKTTMPFVELNKIALDKTLTEVMNFQQGNKVSDENIEKLISNGSFGKIYAYNISKQINEQKSNSVEEGIWKKYRYKEGKKLAKSIAEKNTGWCITSETIAANYLEYGNIHIYYTKDESGNYTIPRICIRQEDNRIAEIKGVADSKCNLEDSMLVIAESKISELPGNKKTKEQIESLKKLLLIYKKHNNNEELSKEELRFLYEIDKKIDNLGYGQDNRIKEILKKRNPKEDLSIVFNCSPDRISLSKEELTNDSIYIHYGDIDYHIEEDIIIPPIVIGNIDLKNNREVKGFEKLQFLGGSLIAKALVSADNFSKLELITANLNMPNLKSARGLENLKKVGKTVNLPSLINLNGLNNLKETGNLCIKNAKYSDGLENLETVTGNLDISNMRDLSKLRNLKIVEKNVICYASNSLDVIPNIIIKGDTHFYHLINIYGLINKIRTR